MGISYVKQKLGDLMIKDTVKLSPVYQGKSDIEDIFTINAISRFLKVNYGTEAVKYFNEKGELPDNIKIAFHGISLSRAANMNIPEIGDLLGVINLVGVLNDGALKSGSKVKEKYEEGISSSQAYGEGVYIGRNLVNPLDFARKGAFAVIDTGKLLKEMPDLEIKDNNSDGKTILLFIIKKISR